MLNQLRLDLDGQVRDKVEASIQILKTFEPPDGYYVAFSGGKDSQCVYHLCQMAGVKFDAHYAVTSVDPPELVRFIKDNYPDVQFERQHYPDGKPITMWSLIADHTLPPTRKVRYCCASLKETGGEGRRVVTGVRWAESPNRKESHGYVDFKNMPKSMMKLAKAHGVTYKVNKHGGVILLNNDNDKEREMVEHCPLKAKVLVNPILDWEDEDVWEFLNGNGIPHCCLYDEGFKRLGCIGCPLSGHDNMLRDFKRWPKYEKLYKMAFQHMIDNHPGQIKILEKINGGGTQQLMQREPLEKPLALTAQKKSGGGSCLLQNEPRSDAMVSQRMELTSSGASSSPTATENFEGGGTTIRALDGHCAVCLNTSSTTGNKTAGIGHQYQDKVWKRRISRSTLAQESCLSIGCIWERYRRDTMDLIDRADVFDALADMYPTDGEAVISYKEIDRAYEKVQSLPAVPAVPMEQLCEWLANQFGCPCFSPIGEEMFEHCNGDCYVDDIVCWKRVLTKWMEEQEITT